MGLPIVRVDGAVQDDGRGKIISFRSDKQRLTAGLAYAGHGDLICIHLRKRSQVIDNGIDITQDFLVAQVAVIVAAGQDLAIAREAREKIRHDGHIPGVDELFAQVCGVLNDTVAFVQMNDRGMLTTSRRLAEEAVDSVIDANWTEHGFVSFKVHSSQAAMLNEWTRGQRL